MITEEKLQQAPIRGDIVSFNYIVDGVKNFCMGKVISQMNADYCVVEEIVAFDHGTTEQIFPKDSAVANIPTEDITIVSSRSSKGFAYSKFISEIPRESITIIDNRTD